MEGSSRFTSEVFCEEVDCKDMNANRYVNNSANHTTGTYAPILSRHITTHQRSAVLRSLSIFFVCCLISTCLSFAVTSFLVPKQIGT